MFHVFGNQVKVAAFFRANAAGFKRPKAIRFKSKILSPGAYIDNRKTPSHPGEWRIIMTSMINKARSLRPHYDVIASVATGGIIHGGVIAWHHKVPHVIVKMQPKEGHGLGGLIDGDPSILRDVRVLLVEDMSTTFESSLAAIEILKANGARVAAVLMLNTWNFPIFQKNIRGHEVYAICTGEMLLNYAVEQGGIDVEHQKIIRHWLQHPEDESWSTDGTWELPTNEKVRA